MASEKPLLSKLSSMLGAVREQVAPPPPPPPPAPAHDAASLARLEECKTVIQAMTRLLDSLSDKMALLQTIMHALGVCGPTTVAVRPSLAIQRRAIEAYLRETPAAAQLVSSVVLRFDEATRDLQVLSEQVMAGDWETAELETFKGKYLFLCKMGVYFKDFPLVHQLFAPGAAVMPPSRTPVAPAAPPRPAPAAAVPRPATAPLGPPPEDEDSLVEQGTRLLRGLADRVPVLQAAVSTVLGRSVNTMLPPPAQQTVKTLVPILSGDNGLFNRIQRYLQQYQHAKMTLGHRPIPNPPQLKQSLAMIAGFHVQFQDQPFLHELFVVQAT